MLNEVDDPVVVLARAKLPDEVEDLIVAEGRTWMESDLRCWNLVVWDVAELWYTSARMHHRFESCTRSRAKLLMYSDPCSTQDLEISLSLASTRIPVDDVQACLVCFQFVSRR